ncbi:MAG: winged helix DNA-binding protein [Treponema sp.]|nr:winged helix DNA-binding protein [Treponema sp.]
MITQKTELLEQLIRLERLLHFRHLRAHRERGPMGDPHRGQGRILALLKLKPEMSQQELSTILDIRSQSLGELLAKLERQGYLHRSPSEADRRAMVIRLTEEGAAAAETATESSEADGLFGCLSEEERVALGGYLERLIASWEEELGAAGADEELITQHGWHDRGHGFGRGRGPGPDPRHGPGFPEGGPRGGFFAGRAAHRPNFGERGFGPAGRGEL